ncbi:hypothetical protein D3C80_1667840 [compost metagenome]
MLRIDIHPKQCQRSTCLRQHALHVNHSGTLWPGAQAQVFRHAHILHQAEFLIDRPHAKLTGTTRQQRLWPIQQPVADKDLPGVRSLTAGQHADQGRLARAVFPQQGTYLTSPQGEIHILQRHYPRVTLMPGFNTGHHRLLRQFV